MNHDRSTGPLQTRLSAKRSAGSLTCAGCRKEAALSALTGRSLKVSATQPAIREGLLADLYLEDRTPSLDHELDGLRTWRKLLGDSCLLHVLKFLTIDPKDDIAALKPGFGQLSRRITDLGQ